MMTKSFAGFWLKTAGFFGKYEKSRLPPLPVPHRLKKALLMQGLRCPPRNRAGRSDKRGPAASENYPRIGFRRRGVARLCQAQRHHAFVEAFHRQSLARHRRAGPRRIDRPQLTKTTAAAHNFAALRHFSERRVSGGETAPTTGNKCATSPSASTTMRGKFRL